MPADTVPSTTRKDIETLAQMEQEFLRQRSRIERAGMHITRFFGSLPFLLVQTVLAGAWVLFNTGVVEGTRPFDPYPFPFLALAIALEAIFLSTFVLMSQSLQSRRAEQWAQLNLHICLLAERETTKVLEMQQAICHFLGLEHARDTEVKEMARQTEVVALVQEMEKTRQIGEGVAQEIEKVCESEKELVGEIKKAREAKAELAAELEKARAMRERTKLEGNGTNGREARPQPPVLGDDNLAG